MHSLLKSLVRPTGAVVLTGSAVLLGQSLDERARILPSAFIYAERGKVPRRLRPKSKSKDDSHPLYDGFDHVFMSALYLNRGRASELGDQ